MKLNNTSLAKAFLGFFVLTVLAAGFAVFVASHARAGSFIDKDTFYYLNVSYFRGGFLSDERLIVKINDHKVNFFGDDYSKIMRYGGTDTAIVNGLLKKGKNTITVEIQKAKGASGSVKEACEFGLVLELKKKGEIVDTGKSASPIFQVEKKLEPSTFNRLLIAQGEFII